MLDVKPILCLDPAGRVVPVDRVRGRENLVPRVLSLLEKRLTPRPRLVRFGVAHTEAPEMAERVRTALVAAYRPRDCFVTLATGVLGTHVGPGAWAIFYQVEDGTPGGTDRMTPRFPEALRLALDAIQDLKAQRARGTRLAGADRRHRLFRDRLRHLRRPRPRHRGVGHREAGPAGSHHPPRGGSDQRPVGTASTSWTSWSICSTRRLARSISSSGSGMMHRSS